MLLLHNLYDSKRDRHENVGFSKPVDVCMKEICNDMLQVAFIPLLLLLFNSNAKLRYD